MTIDDASPWRAHRGPPWATHSPILPLVVGAIQVLGTYFASFDQPGHRHYDVGAVLLLAAGPAALAFRRRQPVAVLFFVLATTISYNLLDYPRGPVFLALIVAFFTAEMAGRRIAAVISLVIGYLAFVWLDYLVGIESGPSVAEALGLAAWLLVLLTVAEVVRGRRERAIELARTRAEEAKRRASEERLRMARDLHDVLAHNISLINVQAGVALHLIDESPEQARTALAAIKQASNEALGELRSVLDVLRHGNEAPPRAPASRLARLDELVSQAKAAGLKVSTRVDGPPRPLPAGIELAAFRIVQESLTNIRRHAGGAQAKVLLSYGDQELAVEIDDNGPGRKSSTSTGGRGIAGMRERAAALGGSLEAGPKPDGGFRVHARLPLDGTEERQ